MTPKFKENCIKLNFIGRDINQWAIDKGFWEAGLSRNKGEMIALMHSELSEALEGFRHGNPRDEHCPDITSVEIEMADCIIRILDFCHGFGFNIGAAVAAKMEYNESRPHKHGKKF